ncbi:MAG: hypothetical protein HY920_03560 [Elusimicrobia bacterium]|nr:hypothetical protein [Elusimicrobiota bacterium]
MTEDNPIHVILAITEIFEKMGIPYLIGGSLASSVYGEARATRDVDIVAAIEIKNVKELVENLQDKYYIDDEMIRAAVQRKSSFNLIHFESQFKVDVYVLKQEAFSLEEFKRRRKIALDQNPEKAAFFATAEDTILSKLLWFKKGGEVSDRQWNDIAGVVKVQRDRLDKKYLKHWAQLLDVAELWERISRENK